MGKLRANWLRTAIGIVPLLCLAAMARQGWAQSGQLAGQTTINKSTPPPDGPAGGGAWSVEVNRSSDARSVIVDRIELVVEDAHTWLVLSASQEIEITVLSLEKPYRAVVDLPRAVIELPAGVKPQPQGLVSQLRFGQLDSGTSRIVLDTTAPVQAEKASAERRAGSPGGYRMGVRLTRVEPSQFRPSVAIVDDATVDDPAAERGRGASDQPVIVIDPGHGGIDSGAVGAALHEKDVVLAVGRRLYDQLSKSGRYDVRLTRSSDVFLTLDRRIAISQKAGASLFISLHADSILAKDAARNIRGATVYTLSNRASDEWSRRVAEKENAADAAAGLPIIDEVEDERVKGILLDLMSRESQSLSGKFSGLLVDRLRRGVVLAKDPTRSAAFKVLRQPQTPAVLVEIGYVSNNRDESLLASAEWQAQVAASIAAAVDQYFAK